MERIAQSAHLRKPHPAGTEGQPLAHCNQVSYNSLFTALFLHLPQLSLLPPLPTKKTLHPPTPAYSHQGRGVKRYTQEHLGKSPGLTHRDQGAQNPLILLSAWPLGLIG